MAFAVMFAPVADAAVCADEAPAVAAEKHNDGAVATPSEAAVAIGGEHGGGAPSPGGDLGLCQHGHCHHAAPYLPILGMEVAAPTIGAEPVTRLTTQHVQSHTGSRLERPPRA